MTVFVKICGLSTEAGVQAAAKAGADYAGFVHFERSPRHISIERAAELAAALPQKTQSVIVVAEPDDALVATIAAVMKPHFIQLHGKETPSRVREIRNRAGQAKIIKAVAVSCADDIAQALQYSAGADMLLFDAKPPQLPNILPGGNGLSFDWALLANREFPLPWFLSGGLHAQNVCEAVQASGARMVDVSSGVESAPGVKDPSLITAFVKAAKNA